MDRSKLCDSLIIWMQTFGLDDNSYSVNDFCDGILMSKVLHQIAPEYFSSHWLSRINSDDVTNWRLKVSNLKKVLNGIIDYNAEMMIMLLYNEVSCEVSRCLNTREVLGFHIPNNHMPDVIKIGEVNEKVELSRMLQLILSCAVNCQEKQEYIQRIMNLEESVQHMVMTAIQELMIKDSSSSSLTDTDSEIHEQLKKVGDKLNYALQENDELAQRCHELDMQVATLLDENAFLTRENIKLTNNLDKSDNIDDPTTPAGRRIQQQQNLISSLQEEVYRHEAAKEDLRIKVEFLMAENEELHKKVTDLTREAQQASTLRDEVDMLRHTSEQVEIYETTIESYKKRVDELAEYKEQLKMAEEKIAVLAQEKTELQDDAKKAGSIKDQLYNSKKHIVELESNLEKQTKIAQTANINAAARDETIDMLKKEKERLRAERDSLKELNEELQCVQLSNAELDMAGDHLTPSSPASPDMLSVPLPIRQKIVKLEHELKTMRPNAEKYDVLETERDSLRAMVDEAKDKQAHLQREIETVNERLTTLEVDKADLENGVRERDIMVATLEQKLVQTQQDMILVEERYKKYLEKAKSLIHSLDPRLNPSATTDVHTLQSQLASKDRCMQQLEKEFERLKSHKEKEKKLMVSAWYNMNMELEATFSTEEKEGMQCHRKAVEDRLSTSMAGQSFLARQRQAHTRRVLPSTQHSPYQTMNK